MGSPALISCLASCLKETWQKGKRQSSLFPRTWCTPLCLKLNVIKGNADSGQLFPVLWPAHFSPAPRGEAGGWLWTDILNKGQDSWLWAGMGSSSGWPDADHFSTSSASSPYLSHRWVHWKPTPWTKHTVHALQRLRQGTGGMCQTLAPAAWSCEGPAFQGGMCAQ